MPPGLPSPPHLKRILLSWILTLLAGIGSLRPAHAADPVVLTNQHVDLRVTWTGGEPDPLDIDYFNSDTGSALAATNGVLRIPESARTELPEGFPELGPAGSFLWILPQSQDPDRVYLGFRSAVGPGLLDGPVALSLREVRGPGAVMLWQAGFDGLTVRWNSRDGLDASDATPLPGGSHGHYNLGFSTNGVYELVLRAEGTGLATGGPVRSADTVLRVEVLPLPQAPVGPGHLTVVGPPVGGRLSLRLAGTPGTTYRIEAGTDLARWETVAEVTADVAPVGFELSHDPEAPGLFLRATHP